MTCQIVIVRERERERDRCTLYLQAKLGLQAEEDIQYIIQSILYYYYMHINVYVLNAPGAGFMNRRGLCQLTAAILTSDLTTRM